MLTQKKERKKDAKEDKNYTAYLFVFNAGGSFVKQQYGHYFSMAFLASFMQRHIPLTLWVSVRKVMSIQAERVAP